MKKFKKILIISIRILFLSCNATKTDKPKVVSTIGMIHNMVEEIAKDNVNAIAIMGPGIDPHLYKASAGDVKKISTADLILYNGLHLEAKMIDILKKMKAPAIAVTAMIPTINLIQPAEYEGFYDPHVWFDVTLWKIAANEVKKALIELDPKNKVIYEKNHNHYQNKLTELNVWIETEINSIPKEKRILVTAHDAFNYFGNKYNFKVVGLQGINTTSQAGTKDIQNVANIILKHRVPTIFIESSVPVRQIEAVKDAVNARGWNVKIGNELFTDAMGDEGTEEGSYIGMIRHNISSIVNGLK